MKKEVKYSIGLDIGTNSVGWAVTDENNNLLRFRGKNMFGVRLFDDAKTAAERRKFRSTRRRLARRRQRIKLLREIFELEIKKVDSTFFQRLNETFLHKEDRTLKNKSNLFIGDLFNSDKEYYDKYKTIYHLRHDLMTTDEQKDIRLIYLALHHAIKYRGNFLYEGTDFNIENVNIEEKLQILFDFLEEELQCEFENNTSNINKVKQILIEDKAKSEKVDEILSILKPTSDSKKIIKELFKAITNQKFSLNKIFLLDGEEISIYINDYSEKLEDIENYLGDWFDYLLTIDEIYQWTILKNILKSGNTLSEAMIQKYHKHQKDLLILKKLARECKIYDNIFKNIEKTPNYYAYIYKRQKTNTDEFYKYLKKQFQPFAELLENNSDYKYMINSIEKEDFIPKINSKDNGAIPYQLHKNEVEKIIDNQSKYYPFLKENKDKIISILEFKIPYYVGPLNPNSPYTTIVKNNNEIIYPWNFDQIVDKQASSIKFMEERIGHCTYLPQYKVMPKNSLTYSLYCVLNELNKIRIDKKFIDVNIKNRIIKDLFLKQKKVSDKSFRDYLFSKGFIPSKDVEITGYQAENGFATNLGPWIDFINIFGEFDFGEKLKIEKYEKIILMMTMIQDKDVLKQLLEKEYKDLTTEQIQKIISKKYGGFSSLSREFIDGELFIANSNGEPVTILDQLYNSNLNLSEIINNDELGFKEAYEKLISKSQFEKITYDDIAEIPGSPAIKRGIWQTVKIVEEIIKIMKCPPENIFIEVARGEDKENKNKRTKSRLQKMLDIYKKISEETTEYNDVYSQLKEIDKENGNLDDKALYLYFIQGGKCLYTGKELDIKNLDKYQIDHIIPQWIIKDDSFDNLALVTVNQEKGERLGMPEQYIKRQYQVWKRLLNYGLINEKKFQNLIKTQYTKEDIEGFINRQLVETRQITKHILNLFKTCYDKTNIVVLRPDLLSNFRKQFKFYKIRDLNDFHHAHDALISCFVGNYLLNRYPKLSAKYIYDDYLKFKEKEELEYGVIISRMRYDYKNEERNFVWNAKEQIEKFAKYFNYKDCLVTKKLEEGNGAFYDQLPLKKGATDNLISLKKGLDPKKYGGYNKLYPAYFLVVKYKKGKKTVKELVQIPIYIKKLIEAGKTTEQEYLKSIVKEENIKIISNKIFKNQLIKWQNDYFYIIGFTTSGGNAELQNAKQLMLESKYYNMLHFIDKLDDESLNELYLYIVNKMKHYNILQKVRNKLIEFNKKFINVSKNDKKKIIKEILKITSCKSQNANLSNYGGPSELGRLRYVLPIEQIIFIHQSVTGLYEVKRKI